MTINSCYSVIKPHKASVDLTERHVVCFNLRAINHYFIKIMGLKSFSLILQTASTTLNGGHRHHCTDRNRAYMEILI